MRTLLLIAALLISFLASIAGRQRTPDPLPNPWNSGQKIPINPKDCTYRGIPLYGDVRIVSAGADFKVRVVEHFPDLRVSLVDLRPSTCGQWRLVSAGEDFTVELVEYGGEFSIKYVDIAPGIR